ncbi:MAG: hypothetical protein SGILL_004838 [Bacillariaceae sp.]
MDTTSNMLIDQVADLELQNEDLREQLENRTDDNRKLAKAVKTLKEQLDITKDVSVHSNNQSRSTKGTVSSTEMDRRLKEAEQSNEGLAETIETMRKQIKDLTSPDRDDSSGRSSVRASVLEAELREAKIKIESLTMNAKMQQTESANHDSEEKQRLDERISELEGLLTKAAEKEAKLVRKASESKDKYKAARDELKQRDALLVGLCDMEQLQQDLEASQEMNKDLKSQLITLKTEAAASRGQGDETEQLAEKLSKLHDDFKKATAENEKLSKEVQSSKEQMNASTHGAQEENLRLIDQCTQLESKLEAAKNRYGEEKEDSLLEKKMLEERISQLQEELGCSTAENEARSSEITGSASFSENEHKELQERCTTLEKQLNEAKNENERLESQTEQKSTDLDETNHKCSKLEKKLNKSSDKKEKLSQQVAELQAKLDSIEMEHLEEQEELVSRCQELEQRMFESNPVEAPKQLDAQEMEKISELETKIEELTDERDTVKVQLNIYKKKLEDDTESERNQELRERCGALEQELEKVTERNEQLTKQVDSLSATVRGLQTNAEKMDQELEQANITIENLNAAEAPHDDDFGRLLERCTDLEAEKSQIEWQLKQQDGSSEELEAVRKERDELQQELDTALADLVEFQAMGGNAPNTVSSMENEELNDRLGALVDAKDELKKLLDEAVEENASLAVGKKKMNEQVEKAKKDRDDIDGLYQQAKHEIAEFKAKLITAEEVVKQAKEEGEELARLLEIEKQVSDSRKAAANSSCDEENELEELYRQSREEMKELEEMLMEAEEQIEHLKALNEKLSERTSLSRQDLIETELSSETIHSLEGLSRDELMKENRKTLHKLQEARTHAVDQQENITILQAQLRDAMKFHANNPRNRRAPRRNRSGGGGGAAAAAAGGAAAAAAAARIGGLWNRVKNKDGRKPQKEEAAADSEMEGSEAQIEDKDQNF